MHPSTHARTTPEKPACIMAATGEILTYGVLDRRANQGAHLFRSLGINRGDVIAILLDNSLDNFEIAWAAQRAGLYLTSISTKLSPADIGYILADSGAKLFIIADRFIDLAATNPATTHIEKFCLSVSNQIFKNWRTERQYFPTTEIPDPSPGTDMLYSSGTTGRPKGVKPALPEGPLDAATPLTVMGKSLYAMDPTSIYLSTSPLYHAAPLRWAMTIHRLGGTVVIMEQFDAEQALSLIETYHITHATWVPTHFVRLLKLPEETKHRYKLTSLKAVIHAAAPCPVPVKQAMIDWWGPIIHEYYSGTESCGITALSSQEWLQKPGSVGRAVLGELKITDDDGNELGPGQVGQVYFANGPRFEYHNAPEKTADAYNRFGWATLGDIGKSDEDGYLYLTDRKSFMIISGGVNIYPQEIENLIITHPKIADVAVIGAPDEEMGEKVVAIVQPEDWNDAGPALAEELRLFTRNQLGGLKCPRLFDFMEELPREPTGKLMKRLLRQRYQ
jgi:long-chain acyl-CoA synthetase